MNSDDEKPTIYTIGHSNHSINAFIELLRGADVDAVADLRSVPYFKRYPQFQKVPLAQHLKAVGIANVYLERNRARPDNPKCYADGRASYEWIAALPLLRRTIPTLRWGKVALGRLSVRGARAFALSSYVIGFTQPDPAQ